MLTQQSVSARLRSRVGRTHGRIASLIVVVLCSVLPVTSTLVAAPLPGEWIIKKSADPKRPGCLGELSNTDGLQTTFFLDPQYVWSIDFSKSTWRFAQGASFGVALRLATGQVRQPALVVSEQRLRLALEDSLGVFQQLSKSWQLEFESGAFTSKIGLGFGDRVLRDLTRCVNRLEQAVAIKKEAALFAALTPSKDEAENLSKEAAVAGEKLLAAIDTKGATRIQQNRSTFSFRSGAQWTLGPVEFAITILHKNDVADLNTMLPLLVGRDVRGCRGEVFAGTELGSEKPPRKARAYASCVMVGSATSLYYLALPRTPDGYFLMQCRITGTELPEQSERSAASFCDAISGASSVLNSVSADGG